MSSTDPTLIRAAQEHARKVPRTPANMDDAALESARWEKGRKIKTLIDQYKGMDLRDRMREKGVFMGEVPSSPVMGEGSEAYPKELGAGPDLKMPRSPRGGLKVFTPKGGRMKIYRTYDPFDLLR